MIMLDAANKIVNFYELFSIELKRLGHIQIHWTKMHLETFPREKGNGGTWSSFKVGLPI